MVKSEAQLEESLIRRLAGLGYDRVVIPDEAALVANLKRQLEKHNDLQLSDAELANVLNHPETMKAGAEKKIVFIFEPNTEMRLITSAHSAFNLLVQCFTL